MAIPAPQGLDASGLPPTGDQATAVLSGKFTAVGPSQPFSFRGPMNLALWGAVNTSLTTTAGSTAATITSATGIAAGYAINSKNVPGGTTVGVLAGTNVTLAIPAVTLPGYVDAVLPEITGIPVTAAIPMSALVGATVTGPGIPAGTTVLAVTQAGVAATNQSAGTPGVVSLSATPTIATPFNPSQPQQFTFAVTGNAVLTTGADAAALFTGSGINFTGSVQVERSFDGGATWLVCNVGGGGTLAIYSAGTPVNITFGEPERQVLYRLNCTALSAGSVNYRISQTGGANESLAIGPLSGG